MSMQPEKAILFDMDGVIIDSNPYHRIAWEKLLLENEIDFSEDSFEKVIFGRTGQDALRELASGRFSEEELIRLANHEDEIFREIIKEIEVCPIDGLLEFISEVKRNNYKIALVTSAPTPNVTLVLERFRLQDAFDLIVDDMNIENGKPNPEIYLKAVGKLGIPNEQCVVFEDSFSGIQAAKNAGLRVIGLTTSHHAHELINAGADDAIDNFNAFKDWRQTDDFLFSRQNKK